MTRHEKIDPNRPIGFDVLNRAIQQGLDSGPPQEPRSAEAIKAAGRRRLSMRGQ